jgi:tetratricopeptide (TPR) repeat protein
MIKKLIYILILIVISAQIVFAQIENAYIDYSGYTYEFAPGDDVKFFNNANKNLVRAEKTKSPTNKQFYLNESMRYYFLLSQINPNSVEAQIGLGRVYDDLKIDKYAQKHFFNAINLDYKNPKANYYFGNYYFARNDFITAQNYYNTAYRFGYIKSYYLNYKLGIISEKLGDIEKAIKYYYFALKLNPKNAALKTKIQSLDDLNYSHSQYYLFRK